MNTQAFRNAQQVARGYGDIFGIGSARGFPQQSPIITAVVHSSQAVCAGSAAEVGIDYNPLPGGPVIDRFTQGGYLPSPIGAGDVRVLQLQSWPTPADPDIQVVQGSGPQADKHLPWTWLWGRKIGVFEDAGISVFVNQDGFQ